MRKAPGHTLVELAVVLAAAGVLAGLAGPSFAATLADVRRLAAITEILGAIDAARRVAAARGRSVSLCVTDSRGVCGARVARGLAVEDDSGALGAQRLLERRLPESQRLQSNRDVIRLAAGGLAATPASLVLCDRRGSRAARAVIVSRSGRPRVSERDAQGRTLSCPEF